MAAEHWFRWHHGTVTDPKWRIVAKRASHAMSRNVTVGHVVSVWAAMLENASQANPRGELSGWCDEDIAVAFDMDEAEVRAIREAMQGKTLEGDELCAWNRRQIKREDDSAADRKRAQRIREKAAGQESPTRDNSQCHAPSRNVPLETETETETEEKQKTLSAVADLPADRSESGKSGQRTIPVQLILAAYHERCPMMPAVRVMTDARKRKLKARWTEDASRQTVEYWQKFFAYVAASDFLTGRDSRWTGCDFEWLIEAGNHVKVIEGKYENREPGA